MKSKDLSTNKLRWDDPTIKLSPSKRVSQSLLKIIEAGYAKIEDLLWIIPLRSQRAPKRQSFDQIKTNQIFLGRGKIINTKFTPAFGRRGKNKVQLFNVSLVVKDSLSEQYLNLKWFNAYPGLKRQLSNLEEFNFMGTPSEYKGVIQISNPTLNPKGLDPNKVLIEYPTINSVPGAQIQKIIEKIPHDLWQQDFMNDINSLISKGLGENILKYFRNIHGIEKELNLKDSLDKLIYCEFFSNQLQVYARKMKSKKLKAPKINSTKSEIESYKKIFPYELTLDQQSVLEVISNDLRSGIPMMRMIQGDVGSGKTTVAIIAALINIKADGQVAIMCPTETLARQHAETCNSLLPSYIQIELLLGTTKPKDRKQTLENLENGKIQLIIGTHSLIQESVVFSKLTMAIIDEQHKFGVAQRQKLFAKGLGVHALIMTATPIPRTLQLAQYGDLDISTIRTMPKGRKGTQTRIVTDQTYEKYLTFINTRIELGEQVYIVVPAIEESEVLDIENIDNLFQSYKKIFPKRKIATLHGQLKPEDKKTTMSHFTSGDIDILISTSVIEVGINVLNSTVMAIYNPERFGLSSLHQLRGRVGRGKKAGFCFLITNHKTSKEATSRLRIIEKTNDGFEIAEADLKNRGQGDLFGKDQSGHGNSYVVANIIQDFKIFEQVSKDIEKLKEEQTELVNQVLLSLIEDKNVSSTI